MFKYIRGVKVILHPTRIAELNLVIENWMLQKPIYSNNVQLIN